MTKALHQEIYKLLHRKLPWWIIALMLAYMVVIGIAMRSTYSKLLVMTCYDVSDIVMLCLVIVGSTIFSMEFENKTILNMLYRSANRATVFAAKFITLLLYDVFLHLVAIAFTIIFNFWPVLLRQSSWTATYKFGQPLWVNMLANSGVDMITSALLISFLCLTTCLINSNTWVILINTIIIFMGSGFSNSLIMANSGFTKIMRWNPLNMLNLTSQFYNYGSYHPATMLSNNQLLIGAICYTCIFAVCGYWAFARKNF